MTEIPDPFVKELPGRISFRNGYEIPVVDVCLKKPMDAAA